jgi:molybdopterin-guanine dinucleotide biosynthesis protein B
MDQEAVDLLLVEGFKQAPFPKLELHRPALGQAPLYPQDPWIIAIASDAELTPSPPIPCLDLNDPQQIGEFLLGILGQSRP